MRELWRNMFEDSNIWDIQCTNIYIKVWFYFNNLALWLGLSVIINIKFCLIDIIKGNGERKGQIIIIG